MKCLKIYSLMPVHLASRALAPRKSSLIAMRRIRIAVMGMMRIRIMGMARSMDLRRSSLFRANLRLEGVSLGIGRRGRFGRCRKKEADMALEILRYLGEVYS